jgi:hypothetical protein
MNQANVMLAATKEGIPMLTGMGSAWVVCALVVLLGVVFSRHKDSKMLGRVCIVFGFCLAILLLLLPLVTLKR